MRPTCDQDCKPGQCTVYCEARRAYARALDSFRRAERHGDLATLALATEGLTVARRLAHALHLVPVGSGLTERSMR